MSDRIIYTGIFFDRKKLIHLFKPVFPVIQSHHSTIEFMPKNTDDLDFGKRVKVKVLGRLTTDKMDILLVDNKFSKNKNPHVTLSHVPEVKPVQSNSEIENYPDEIIPIENIYIEGFIGFFQNGEVFPKINESVSIYNKKMDLNGLIEAECKKIIETNNLNESLKTIFGGAALMYALTFPTNLGGSSQSNTQNTEYSQGEFKKNWEYNSKYSTQQLVDVMRQLKEKYPNYVYYKKIESDSVESGIKELTERNKGISKLPYKMVVEKMGSGVTLHLLSGDKRILDYFENKFLFEK